MTVAEMIAKLQTFPLDAAMAIEDEDTHWTILDIGFEDCPSENRVYLSAVGGYPKMEKPSQVA